MRSAIRTITRRSTTNWPLWTSCHKARLNRNQRIVLGETVGTDGTKIAGLPPLSPVRQTRMPDPCPDNADPVIAVGISPMVAAATCTMRQMRPPRFAPRKPVPQLVAIGGQREQAVKVSRKDSALSAGRHLRSIRRAATVAAKKLARLSRPLGKSSGRAKEKVRARKGLSQEDRVTRKV